jgi:hypothetical protein
MEDLVLLGEYKFLSPNFLSLDLCCPFELIIGEGGLTMVLVIYCLMHVLTW